MLRSDTYISMAREDKPKYDTRYLQDEHNVNLNAAGEGDDYLDDDDSDLQGLHIVDEAEFFERFCE